MNIILAIIMGYIFGSIPTGLIVSKRKNIDIRKHGSGSIGGTNAFRVLGKKAGIFVTSVDIIKGVIPTWIALHFGGESIAIIAGISASIGHSYSIFVNFKGGKSVATSTGVMFVLNPIALTFGIIMFVIVLFSTKYVSLASMLAATTVLISILFVEDSLVIQVATIFFAIFIIIRHHSNIKRLIQGKENKAFQKKK